MFRFVLIFISFIAYFPSDVQASHLHAIVIGDTDADNIGNATKITIHKFSQELRKVALMTEMDLNLHLIQEGDLSVKEIYNEIENLTIDADDVVVFFFNGHGYNKQKGHDIWPHMYFTKNNMGLEFSSVVEVILNKNPRLILAISDSCNNLVDYYIPSFKPTPFLGLTNLDYFFKTGYRKLFLQSAGLVQIASAKRGDFSYTNHSNGAFFTNAFLSKLKNEALFAESASWEHLLDETSKQLVFVPQYPLYQLSIQ